MKILQVIPYFVPAWDYGGPLQVCYQLSRELVKRGHEVVVYTTDSLNAKSRIAEPEEIMDGIEVKRFRNLSNTLAYKHNISFPLGMLLSANEIKNFDIIHIHEYRVPQNACIHHYSKKYGVPYVLQAHGSLPVDAPKQILKKRYDSVWGHRILNDASRLIALTPTEAEQYKSMGVSEDKIEIVPNGIDLSEFESLPERGEFRKKYGLSDDQKIVLYLGRIHQTKSIDLLVKAFAGLSKEVSDARLIIVGPDDGYLPSLKKLVADLGISDKVLSTGPLYGREKLEAYVDADVFVTPSFYGFPVTFVEACACGVPIVITERGDNLDWVHNQVGFVTAYNEDELEKAITKILHNLATAKKFGENGQKLTKEKLNWREIAIHVERLYIECMGNSANNAVLRGIDR